MFSRLQDMTMISYHQNMVMIVRYVPCACVTHIRQTADTGSVKTASLAGSGLWGLWNFVNFIEERRAKLHDTL